MCPHGDNSSFSFPFFNIIKCCMYKMYQKIFDTWFFSAADFGQDGQVGIKSQFSDICHFRGLK